MLRHGTRSPLCYAAHRRQHRCSIIEKLACSGFNVHLAAFCSWVGRWDDGGQSCDELLCCAVLLLPFVLPVYASTEVTKKVVLLSESAAEFCEQIIKCVFGKTSAQVLILGKTIYHARRYIYNKAQACLRCVGNNMSKRHIYYTIPTRIKNACKP